MDNIGRLILPSFYFGNVSLFSFLLQVNCTSEIDLQENFVKQSIRSTTEILGPNGLQKLSVPLLSRNSKTPVKDIRIDNSQRWASIHWQSIRSAYGSSPYFEYYGGDYEILFTRKFDFLADLNQVLFNQVQKHLKVSLNSELAANYVQATGNLDCVDLRREEFSRKSRLWVSGNKYHQVFSEKHPFIENLSILDLLFNQGPQSVSFLRSTTYTRSKSY